LPSRIGQARNNRAQTDADHDRAAFSAHRDFRHAVLTGTPLSDATPETSPSGGSLFDCREGCSSQARYATKPDPHREVSQVFPANAAT
jgi:hypothetical protein